MIEFKHRLCLLYLAGVVNKQIPTHPLSQLRFDNIHVYVYKNGTRWTTHCSIIFYLYVFSLDGNYTFLAHVDKNRLNWILDKGFKWDRAHITSIISSIETFVDRDWTSNKNMYFSSTFNEDVYSTIWKLFLKRILNEYWIIDSIIFTSHLPTCDVECWPCIEVAAEAH